MIGIDLSIVGIDLSLRDQRPGQELRARVAAALAIPVVARPAQHEPHPRRSRVAGLHAGHARADDPQGPLSDVAAGGARRGRRRGRAAVCSRPGSAAAGARCTIGVYRRETRDGRDVLGEVPDHPIDPSVGVIRVDDLDGNPIADALPLLVPSGHDGPALRGRLGRLSRGCAGGRRDEPRRARALPAGRRRQHQPARGHGLRDRLPRHARSASAWSSAGEVVKVAAGIRTEHPRRGAATARQRPRHPLHPLGAGRGTGRRAHRRRRDGGRARLRRPAVARRGARDPRRAGSRRSRSDARALPQDWEVRVAEKYEDWARLLVEAVGPGRRDVRSLRAGARIGDVVIAGLNAEVFFETGLEIRARSPVPAHLRARLHERHDRVSPARGGSPARRAGTCAPATPCRT